MRISLANSQYVVASALRPLLFAGIITSMFDVRLSVFAIPITGIPAFVASITACPSTSGSETRMR